MSSPLRRGPHARPFVAAAAWLAVALPAAQAQTSVLLAAAPAGDASRLDRVVVTGSRVPVPLERLAADVVVIDEARIRESTADSLEDLLRREAGVQVSRNGGPGQSSSVLLRGANGSGTVVLVDGVRVGSATLGLVAFETLDLAQVERIEVLRGPGSSLYGADAVGGVVQVFTRRGRGQPTLSAAAAVGELGTREGSLSASGTRGDFDYAATIAGQRSDGVSAVREGRQTYNADRDGFRRGSAALRGGWRPAEGHRVGALWQQTDVNTRYDSADYLPPDYTVADPSPDFRTRAKTRVGALDHEGRWSEALTTTLRLARSQDDSASGTTLDDNLRTRRDVIEGQVHWTPVAGHQLSLAGERQRERVSAGGDGRRRVNEALVLAWLGRYGALQTQADLRRDHNSAYGNQTTGRAGATWGFAEGWRMRALGGTTFRAPSFNELYYPGYGVKTLAPERGRSVELGLDWTHGESEAGLTLWRNRVRDLIGYTGDRTQCPDEPAYTYGCAANIGRATLQGATLAGAHRWGPWRLRASVDFLDAKDDATGQRLQRRAAHQASLAASWEQGAWRVGGALLRTGARPDVDYENFDAGFNYLAVTLPAQTTLDLSARWRFQPGWQLEARLLNATDRSLQPVWGYNGLPRRAWIGLRWDGSVGG